ncbi:hypothetical protein BMF94_5666 [Rhodotorula taiwanensis]|uniref:Peptidase S26 domain-containing protein n=1 Tax=Rhodotorula taiwanensis TaxID=741276 RepID=A0A2S5B3J0_9BASI|nr:hypothetical protein BMF94_5666 [Rhodotorula taiwanensis]
MSRLLPRLKTGSRYALGTFQLLVAVHLFNQHVAEIRPCAGASMYPTLSDRGTLVLHSPLALRLTPLERGNLVTAISPFDPTHQVLKRVIGLPGDTICVDPTGERSGTKSEWCTVPKGHVWIAGDNTSNSTDSRDYGPVPLAMVRGKVIARVWPDPGPLNTTMHRVQRG